MHEFSNYVVGSRVDELDVRAINPLPETPFVLSVRAISSPPVTVVDNLPIALYVANNNMVMMERVEHLIAANIC